MRTPTPLLLACVLPTVLGTACGSNAPNAPEVVEPGDIPDDQVFIAFTAPDGSFSHHLELLRAP